MARVNTGKRSRSFSKYIASDWDLTKRISVFRVARALSDDLPHKPHSSVSCVLLETAFRAFTIIATDQIFPAEAPHDAHTARHSRSRALFTERFNHSPGRRGVYGSAQRRSSMHSRRQWQVAGSIL